MSDVVAVDAGFDDVPPLDDDTLLAEYGIDANEYPPPLIAAAVQGLAFSAVQDRAAGYDRFSGWTKR